MKLIKIHPADNVAVALENLVKGETLTVDGAAVSPPSPKAPPS